ncbi:amino acid ABC transporter permease [Pelagibius sp. CAU 1746]|uniref:amino acid ABC transporter permease n=1 Tax=Pelagibius sp. CAU 1746 TaxID=3140370 RepID=UPI00325AC891
MVDTATQPRSYEPGNHPDLPPPLLTSGPIAWVRENLLGSPLNIILTVVSLYLLYLIVPGLLNWAIFDSVINADSREGCREIADGACWALPAIRFDQFLYGFYPDHLHWRINLTAVLFILALLPVLWDKAPYRKYWFIYTAIFPLIAFILLIGPAAFNMDNPGIFVPSFQAYGDAVSNLNPIALVWTLLGDIFGLIFWILSWIVYPFFKPIGWVLVEQVGMENVETTKLGGFALNTIIGVTGIVASLPLGILLALGRRSHMPIVRTLCVMFIEFIRGVPLITLLFVASTMLNYFLPPGTTFDLILRVLIMVTLFSSAYIAEVVRGGLQAIPKGQTEAADAMGLRYWQSMRLIVLPQALKISIPGIVNTFVGLFKDTTLVVIIGLTDVLGVGRASLSDAKWQGLPEEVYVFTAILFFVCCFSMARYSTYLEKKLHTGHKR